MEQIVDVLKIRNLTSWNVLVNITKMLLGSTIALCLCVFVGKILAVECY